MHKEGYYNCVCCVCGKPVHRTESELRKNKNVHCSRECFAIAKMKKGNHETVRIKLKENAKKPTVATKYSAGLDLYCAEEKEITLKPGEAYLFDTGVAIELPEGTFGGLYARSGLSTKRGLMLMNGVGVIDRDYRNSIKVPLRNMGKEPQTIKPNDRIAQLVIQEYVQAELVEADELTVTERGENGFGSSGR